MRQPIIISGAGRSDPSDRLGQNHLEKQMGAFVRNADIWYRQPLRMFDQFTLRTRIIYCPKTSASKNCSIYD
jgi:acyl-CoA thioesterase FadM